MSCIFKLYMSQEQQWFKWLSSTRYLSKQAAASQLAEGAASCQWTIAIGFLYYLAELKLRWI